jgi:hypothetical protein
MRSRHLRCSQGPVGHSFVPGSRLRSFALGLVWTPRASIRTKPSRRTLRQGRTWLTTVMCTKRAGCCRLEQARHQSLRSQHPGSALYPRSERSALPVRVGPAFWPCDRWPSKWHWRLTELAHEMECRFEAHDSNLPVKKKNGKVGRFYPRVMPFPLYRDGILMAPKKVLRRR